jgi:hypothetical protein
VREFIRALLQLRAGRRTAPWACIWAVKLASADRLDLLHGGEYRVAGGVGAGERGEIDQYVGRSEFEPAEEVGVGLESRTRAGGTARARRPPKAGEVGVFS